MSFDQIKCVKKKAICFDGLFVGVVQLLLETAAYQLSVDGSCCLGPDAEQMLGMHSEWSQYSNFAVAHTPLSCNTNSL